MDKYRPRTSLDVLLSQTELAALRSWLRSGRGVARATAPPGAGLTTAVQLLAKELGMEALWITAASTRAKMLLTDAIGSPVAVSGRPKLVVLDDFDALLSDTQLTSELGKLPAGLATPVLCLGHAVRSSRTDDISRKWTQFKFQKPPARAVLDRARHVAEREGIRCAPGALEDLVAAARGDMRSVLNALDLTRSTQLRVGEDTLDDVVDGMDAVKLLLRDPVPFARAMRMATLDCSVMPMGMYENYLACMSDVSVDIADLYSAADVTDKRMYAMQAWDLMDLYAAQTVAGPAVLVSRGKSLDKIDKIDPQKFGLVWSRMYNQCAKAKNLRALCHSRAEAGLPFLDACDLSYVRGMVLDLVGRGDGDALAQACHGMQDHDVLTLMRLWKTDYKTSTHARTKKMLAAARESGARPR